MVHLPDGEVQPSLPIATSDIDSVRKTGTLVRCEGIITQLVFEHALRIRMKAQTAADSSSVSSTVTSTPDTPSIAESDTVTEATTITSNGTEPSNASIKSDANKGKGKDSKDGSNGSISKGKSSTDNLVGKLNNLITTDLNNIVEGRDFPMLSKEYSYLLGVDLLMFGTSYSISLDNCDWDRSAVCLSGLEVRFRL